MRITVFGAVLLCIASTSLHAQFYKYSNEFLAIGTGARSLGMGSAVTASVQDVTAGYWNPSGLAWMGNVTEIGLMHAEYFAGIAKYDYAAVVLPMQDPMRQRKLTFSLIRFGVDDIPNTLFLIEPDGSINYDNVSSFSVADYAGFIGYAQQTGVAGLSVGGNVKVIHRIAGSFASSWGFGLDAGVQYKKNQWQLGLMGRDITTTFNAWSYFFTEKEQQVFANTNNLIPENSVELTAPRLIMGVARNLELGSNKFVTILPELDWEITFDGKRNTLIRTPVISMDPRLGVEFGYRKTVFLRFGVNNFQQVSDIDGDRTLTVQPNAGAGLAIKSLHVDYALTNLGDLSGSLYSHVFSLRISLAHRLTQ